MMSSYSALQCSALSACQSTAKLAQKTLFRMHLKAGGVLNGACVALHAVLPLIAAFHGMFIWLWMIFWHCKIWLAVRVLYFAKGARLTSSVCCTVLLPSL